MRLTDDWVTRPETQAVMAMLRDGGFAALFVGGCVRNALAGHPVTDIDIATEARPEEVMALSAAAGLKPVPTGVDHGTVTVVSGHVPHEVTTFRRDVETDGRRAVVAFSREIEEDARRRDFTMNALYADAAGKVIDPLGEGVADLRAGRVRFIENAGDRIREDYLRILRFFRFQAWYGDPAAGADPDALAAIAETAAGIDTLSAERLGGEMRKLLAAPDPSPALAAMAATGVLARLLPGAAAEAVAPLVHLEAEAAMAPDPIRRLAALGGEGAAERLRLSRAETGRLAKLREGAGSAAPAAELGYRLGEEAALDAALLRAAAHGRPLEPGAAEAAALGAGAALPVRAADLMPDYRGPALGARLKALEEAWIASGFSLDREALLALPD